MPRWACCCGLGCLLVVVIVVALGAVGWQRIGRPLAETFAELGEANEQTAAAEADLTRLDDQFPRATDEDPAGHVLTDLELDRYVAVREALAPQLGDVASAWHALVLGLAPEGDRRTFKDILGTALGAVRGGARFAAARRDLLVAAVPVLEREGLGPVEALALAELVEWRWLGTAEALPLALPEWRRKEAWELRLEIALLESWGSGPAHVQVDGQDPERALADARGRLAEIEAEAEARRDLAGPTRALLTARRPEILSLGDRAAPLAWLALPGEVGISTSAH